jgi:hypothetical protein
MSGRGFRGLLSLSRCFRGWLRNDRRFRGLLQIPTGCFLGDIEFSFNLVLSGFFFLSLIISEFFNNVSRRRDEVTGRGVLGNPVSAIAAFGSQFRNRVGGSIPAHDVQGVQVQTFIPRAGKPKRYVSSGAHCGMTPLAEPPAGTKKPFGEAADILQHRFPRPEALEGPNCYFWELAEMPVDDPHV